VPDPAPTARFGLTDEEFWTAPYKTRDALEDRLSKARHLGLVIDAPTRVLYEHQETLPVIGCHRVTDAESRAASFDDKAVISAVRLEDGLVRVALVEAPRVLDTSDPGPPEPPPSPDAPVVTYATMFNVDARARLDLPWDRSTFLFTVHLAARDSNRVKVALEPPRYAFKDPALEEARTKAAAETWPAPVDPKPGATMPRYTASADSPKPPATPGLVLALPKRVSVRQRELIVQGAFRLPVRDGDLVRPNPDDPAYGVGVRGATAVIPITLVLRGSETKEPFVVSLRVPSLEPIGKDRLATGQFALDLLAASAMRHRTPQRYFVHAFSGEALAGPHELELVAGAKA
jgi:hypothetical protein